MSATGCLARDRRKLVAIQFIQITLMQFTWQKFNWTFSFVGQLKNLSHFLATGALSRYAAWLLVSNFGCLLMITAGIFFGCAVVVLIKIHPNTVGFSPRKYMISRRNIQFLQRK